MIDEEGRRLLRQQILERIAEGQETLDQLRREIQPLKGDTRHIQPRSTTAVSLVATDGGDNSIPFDPFLFELVRVVDSSNNAYCVEVVTATTSIAALSARQFNPDGSPATPLGAMMASSEASVTLMRSVDGSSADTVWLLKAPLF